MAPTDLKDEFRPTLLVGLGGTGIKIAERIFARAVRERAWLRDRLDVVGIDTDENDLRKMSALERRQLIQISTPERVYQLLDKNPEFEREWFGNRAKFPHEILNMTLLDGAAQIRLLTRLAFTHALKRRAVQQPLGEGLLGERQRRPRDLARRLAGHDQHLFRRRRQHDRVPGRRDRRLPDPQARQREPLRRLAAARPRLLRSPAALR